VIVVSNAAGYPHAVLMERYRRLGYRFDPDDVVTSRKVALRIVGRRPGGRWGLVADEAHGRAELEGMETVFLGDDPAEYEMADRRWCLNCADREPKLPGPTEEGSRFADR
jgi:glycerol-1-phosphatase